MNEKEKFQQIINGKDKAQTIKRKAEPNQDTAKLEEIKKKSKNDYEPLKIYKKPVEILPSIKNTSIDEYEYYSKLLDENKPIPKSTTIQIPKSQPKEPQNNQGLIKKKDSSNEQIKHNKEHHEKRKPQENKPPVQEIKPSVSEIRLQAAQEKRPSQETRPPAQENRPPSQNKVKEDKDKTERIQSKIQVLKPPQQQNHEQVHLKKIKKIESQQNVQQPKLVHHNQETKIGHSKQDSKLVSSKQKEDMIHSKQLEKISHSKYEPKKIVHSLQVEKINQFQQEIKISHHKKDAKLDNTKQEQKIGHVQQEHKKELKDGAPMQVKRQEQQNQKINQQFKSDPKAREESMKLLQILNGGISHKPKKVKIQAKVEQKKQTTIRLNLNKVEPIKTTQTKQIKSTQQRSNPPGSVLKKEDDEYDLNDSFIDNGKFDAQDSDDQREFMETFGRIRSRLVYDQDEEDIPEDSFEEMQRQERQSRYIGKVVDDNELQYIHIEEERERKKLKKTT